MTRINRGNSLMTIFDLPDDEAALRDVIDNHAERILVWFGPPEHGCYIDTNQFDARKLITMRDPEPWVERCEYDEVERKLYIQPRKWHAIRMGAER